MLHLSDASFLARVPYWPLPGYISAAALTLPYVVEQEGLEPSARLTVCRTSRATACPEMRTPPFKRGGVSLCCFYLLFSVPHLFEQRVAFGDRLPQQVGLEFLILD
jgi:hypothetical protein